jgi:hypothetical protein
MFIGKMEILEARLEAFLSAYRGHLTMLDECFSKLQNLSFSLMKPHFYVIIRKFLEILSLLRVTRVSSFLTHGSFSFLHSLFSSQL